MKEAQKFAIAKPHPSRHTENMKCMASEKESGCTRTAKQKSKGEAECPKQL
ncbi:MAG: hypothetical protein ACI4O7_14605 [Aristaeellaceae bacterium]